MDKKRLATIVSHVGKKLNFTGEFQFYSFYTGGPTVIATKLKDFPDHMLVFTSNYQAQYLFFFLTDGDLSESAKLVADLELAILKGKEFSSEQVISFKKDYFCQKGFSALIFLDPEDVEIFGSLEGMESIDTYICQCLSIILLKDAELQGYKRTGMQHIIDILSESRRDFLSLHS